MQVTWQQPSCLSWWFWQSALVLEPLFPAKGEIAFYFHFICCILFSVLTIQSNLTLYNFFFLRFIHRLPAISMVGIAAMWPMLPFFMTTVVFSLLVGRTPAFFNGCSLEVTTEPSSCNLTVYSCPLEGSTAVPNSLLCCSDCLNCVLCYWVFHYMLVQSQFCLWSRYNYRDCLRGRGWA